MTGRTVRIYMADDSIFGIRQCEILNRTILALSVSRARLGELKDWDEASSSGIYFLFGKTSEGDPKAYIGEAQRVIERVSTHVKEKDFWNEVIMFVNKDENMFTKYLEARLIIMATQADRYIIDNGKVQEIPELSRPDTSAMEEMLTDIRLILGVLGHPVLEPREARSRKAASAAVPTPDSSLIGREFVFSSKHFEAHGQVTDEGFLIKRGSTAALEYTAGNPGYAVIRQKLINDGTLVLDGKKHRYTFTKDVSADSSTQAASIVAGGNRSGPASWKSGGFSLSELETAAVAETGAP